MIYNIFKFSCQMFPNQEHHFMNMGKERGDSIFRDDHELVKRSKEKIMTEKNTIESASKKVDT